MDREEAGDLVHAGWWHEKLTDMLGRLIEYGAIHGSQVMRDWACVNGVFTALGEATVSINDRGLLFGDSVYEVLHAHRGRLWLREEHFARLESSLTAILLSVDLRQVELWVEETLRQSGWAEALVYIQITRGTGPRRHGFPPEVRPTVIVTARELVPLAESTRQSGVRVITWPEMRWERRDIKSTNLLPNILAKQQAESIGAFEALLVEANGTVNEGSSTNVFLVQDGTVVTPALGHQILPGVTRSLVKSLAQRLGYEVVERNIRRDELRTADEVFLAGTTTEVLGVVQVDDDLVGSGNVGPVTRRLYDAYREAVRAEFG